MCTVSFIPHAHGYYLGMNRDELLTRPTACPPQILARNYPAVCYPSEPEGGTWVGVNEAGICFALINWHAVREQTIEERVTRGIVIPELLRSLSLENTRRDLERMQLRDMPPFRLIAVALAERLLSEYRWNGRQLRELPHAWESQHWFSSGYDEAQVQIERTSVCRRAWGEPDSGRLPWLRRLHSSHEPERGPFSICMHRSGAATVSYTEIVVTRTLATMRYVPGPLCREIAGDATDLSDCCEESTLRLRPVAGALLSSRLSTGIGYQADPVRCNAPDESDIQEN